MLISSLLVSPSSSVPPMRLRRLLALPIVALAAASPAADPPLRGYSADDARIQREWEAKLRAIPDPARMREAMRRLSARPHHVGSPYGKANAEWLLAQFRSYGWDAQIEQFDVLFPTPKTRVLELVAPTRFVAKLDEPVLPVDPTTAQKSEQLPTYNAYSADGDVTGPLVYVNYGVPADYDALERRGISVKGAIVIARYGGSWRGIKPKVAAEHGAVGCLIYSDPRDDGYSQGTTYPNGPYRPRDGVQRGSVMDMPVHPGDPLTPGVGATKDATRLAIEDADVITKIPVLPISYADAEPLLAAMTGPVAPEGWRGALPITYRLGPGVARVHLKLAFNWDIKPLYNVIARIPGSTLPDEWVIRGNHHDAWVNGAEDPISGLVAELEEARAMGELRKQGWQPKRTIIYAAWDGEEPALLGSTEWAEAHADELATKAVMYLNSDTNGRGFLGMEGSHTLERFVNDVARDVEDPEAKVSVWKRAQAAAVATGSPGERTEARTRADLRIGALGSGSDFTPFLQHLGIAALNIGFGGEDGGGIYHSIYDSFYWYTHFSDTAFVYGRALAQTAGTAVMRMADAEVLPFEFTNFAETVRGYIGELKELREGTATRIAEQNRQIDDAVFAATNDPRRPLAAPTAEAPPPHFDFSGLDNVADRLTSAATDYEKALDAAIGTGNANAARRSLADVNRRLITSERALTSRDGLPNRPWFRHLLYAPGFYTGYGVKTMPGAREAIEQKQWTQVQVQIARIVAALNAEAELISSAAAALRQIKG
jgi:N-acetylated-alpha-linked acidic dipeptidase